MIYKALRRKLMIVQLEPYKTLGVNFGESEG